MECPPEEAGKDSEIILQVRGVSPSTNAFTVQIYFENNRRSGGGEIKKINIKDGIFYIEFKDEQVIDVVLKKKHIIDKTAIEVRRCPPKPVPTCSNKVFLTNISEKTTRDGLENFLEAKANVTPVSIEYGELRRTALITFEEDIDFEKLQLACKKRTLDDSHLEVSPVPVTNRVIVRNISKSMSHDTLLFYFDNEKRSGVSGVMDVKMLDGFCLVYFEEPEAVDIVCGRPHRILDQDLDIKLYHECLGQIETNENPLKHPPRLELYDKKKLERKKQPVQEEKQLKRHILLLLQFCKFEQKLQRKYKDISLKYDISKNVVKFEGLSEEVTYAVGEMYEFASQVAKTEVRQFSKLLQQFLQQQPVYIYVNSKMKERNTIGIWEFCKGEETLKVFSLSDQQAVQAAHLIKESVKETPIKLTNELTAVLSSTEWQSKVDEIEQIGQGLIKIITQADQGRIIILCTDQWEGLAWEFITHFMLPNLIYEESLNLEQAMMKYLQMNCAGDLANISRNLQQQKVNVVVNNTGIVIKATQTGLHQAKYAIDKIVKGVEKQTYSINKAGIRKHMESSAGQEKLRKIERSEGVVIKFSDENASDKDTGSSWLTTGANQQELAVCVTKEGKKISAMVMDILELDVDVIVNFANKDMKHIGGGRSIQDECNYYVRKKGRRMEGQVYLSAAGNLRCRGVIHAVGPVWQNLREAVFNSLEVTSKSRMTSIAFPALCTGVFGHPVREDTRVIVVAVRDFFKENPGSSVEAVYLCGLDKETVNCCATAMMREMRNVIFKSEERENQWKFAQVPVPANTGASAQGGNYGNSSSSYLSDSEELVIDFGQLEFRVYKGDITRASVDVIVNSTNPEFDLTRGLVSKIILQKGGTRMEKQVELHKNELVSEGLALTTAEKLNCQFILHLDAETQNESWEEKIKKCLLKIEKANVGQSVAFPKLGQAFGLSTEDLAKHFFKAIINVKDKVSNLKQIHVVIFDTINIRTFLGSFQKCCQGYSSKSQGVLKTISKMFGYGKSDPGADIWGKAHKAPRPVEDMKSVTLVVYGKDVYQIRKAIRIIEDDMDDILKSKVYAESIIKQFSSSQKNEIQNLQMAHDVDVCVETRIGRITVHGLIEDVMNASEKVHQMIRKAEAIQQEKQAAEMMADMVEWCFLDAGSIPSKLEKYPPNINLQLEKALRKQESKTSFCDAQGVKYIVDFTTYEEYPESDPSDSVKVIRKSKIDGSSFELPPTWSSMDSKENVSVVTLLQKSQEYQDVQNDFVQSTGHTIVKIERIQNRMLLQQYEAKLKLLQGQNPAATTNEQKLWHGTANESVASINTYGFNRSYCGKNAVVHGNGVYFAVNASYSARDQYSPRDFNKNKRIYRCRVLTGEFCQGAQGMKVPPNKPNTGAGSTHILYDSVVDNVKNPGIFVIFNDTQAYPEYLITFQ